MSFTRSQQCSATTRPSRAAGAQGASCGACASTRSTFDGLSRRATRERALGARRRGADATPRRFAEREAATRHIAAREGRARHRSAQVSTAGCGVARGGTFSRHAGVSRSRSCVNRSGPSVSEVAPERPPVSLAHNQAAAPRTGESAPPPQARGEAEARFDAAATVWSDVQRALPSSPGPRCRAACKARPGRRGRRRSGGSPVIHARPVTDGTTASRSPTFTRRTTRPTNRVSSTDSATYVEPISPRADSTATRAEVAVPVGARSRRPGETIVACRASPPTRGGATKTTKDRCDKRGLKRMRDRHLLVDDRPDALAELRQLARLGRDDREPQRGRVDERAERAAVRDVDRQASRGPGPRPARRARARRTGTFSKVIESTCPSGARGRHAHQAGRAPPGPARSPARPSAPCRSRAGRARCTSCWCPTCPRRRRTP